MVNDKDEDSSESKESEKTKLRMSRKKKMEVLNRAETTIRQRAGLNLNETQDEEDISEKKTYSGCK